MIIDLLEALPWFMQAVTRTPWRTSISRVAGCVMTLHQDQRRRKNVVFFKDVKVSTRSMWLQTVYSDNIKCYCSCVKNYKIQEICKFLFIRPSSHVNSVDHNLAGIWPADKFEIFVGLFSTTYEVACPVPKWRNSKSCVIYVDLPH